GDGCHFMLVISLKIDKIGRPQYTFCGPVVVESALFG
ncbi:MAG: hypothetical protein ACI860_001092, partial [Chitinophagales bacterium]